MPNPVWNRFPTNLDRLKLHAALTSGVDHDRFVRATYRLDALPASAADKYVSGSPQQSFKFQAPMSVL